MKAPRDFSGQAVLVTGAAGGLGAALCRQFAAQGANNAALDLDPAGLLELKTALAPDALTLAGDITDPGTCREAVARCVDHFGALNVLVNNAGISHRSLLASTDPAVIRHVMAVNFFGAMELSHAALPHLLRSQGALAAISSVAGFAPLLGRTGYSASKHALHGFFESLRSEVEALGVDVTLVCPSFIATGIASAALGGQGGATARARVAAGGESQPDDIAQRIVRAMAQRRRLLLPDRTSTLAWWIHKLAPDFYAHTMKRRVGAEFAP